MISMLIARLRPASSLRRGGFSLVDVLIGMVLLGLALMFGLQISIAASRITQSNMHVTSAANLAEVKIEELRNVDYNLVVDGVDPTTINPLGQAGGIYTRSWTVVEDSPDVGLKTVTVLVSWDNVGQTATYELTGVIAE